MPWALALALLRAGKSMAARMAMMAITTSSSISVNARELVVCLPVTRGSLWIWGCETQSLNAVFISGRQLYPKVCGFWESFASVLFTAQGGPGVKEFRNATKLEGL